MEFTRLEKNLCDIIYEAQLKVGYERRSTSMNYPLGSLNRLLGTNAGEEEMPALLEKFADNAEERLGRIEVDRAPNGIFRLTVPEKGVERIHEAGNASDFLAELISLVKQMNVTFEDVLAVFRRHSDRVHVEKSGNEEFDWLVYFEDGTPDAYYYCFTCEGPMVTYHRLTKEDYDELGL